MPEYLNSLKFNFNVWIDYKFDMIPKVWDSWVYEIPIFQNNFLEREIVERLAKWEEGYIFVG